MNVVIYARYSYQGQRETSIEGQLEVCRRYAEQNNLQIINEYIDRAISGRTDQRPSFQRMIADSTKRTFAGVLVYQLDRFARDRYDSAIYKERLKRNGVKVISAMEPISDDASGVLMEAVLEGMAEYYSRELAQKIRRGQKICIENGTTLGGQTPLGYKIVDKNMLSMRILPPLCAESTRCTLQMLQWPISSVILTNRVLRHKRETNTTKTASGAS